MEPRIGGAVELRFHHASLSPKTAPIPERLKKYEAGHVSHHRVTRFEPPRFLSMTWGGGGEEPSEVGFELTPQGDKVRLVLTHRRLADRETMTHVGAGWHTHLGILVEHLNGSEPRPFWPAFSDVEGDYAKRMGAE